MTDAELQEVQNTLKSLGWGIIKGMIEDSFLEGKKPVNIKTDGKTADMIAMEVIAKQEAAKAMQSFFRKLAALSNKKTVEKQVYK